MPSNISKYIREIHEQTARYFWESGKERKTWWKEL